MKRPFRLTIIAIIAGTVLAGFLKVIQLLTGKQAYVLLFNMDYIPVLKHVDKILGMGFLFHYTFCIVSVLALYYFLKIFQVEKQIIAYIVIYTIGSAILFSLTALTEKPPEVTDYLAWAYWSFTHAIFGIVVGILVKKWDRY